MSEPTLAIAFKELKARVGSFLGWGMGADYSDTAYTAAQQFEIDGIVASGLRQFYYPKAVDGTASSYDWSFLRPIGTATFASGASTMALPDDFGGFDGQLSLASTTTTSMPWRIEWRNEGQLREMYSVNPSQSGPPMYASEQPLRGTQALQGQKFQLLIFPLADQAYTVQFSYFVNPDYLSGALPYAYGGAQHAETILESCLAIAEQRLDDSATVHSMKFQERLQASISMDRRNKPQKIGRNVDRSDDLGWSRELNHWAAPAATYNGGSFN